MKMEGRVSTSLTMVALASGKAAAILARAGATAAPDMTVNSDNDRSVGINMRFIILDLASLPYSSQDGSAT